MNVETTSPPEPVPAETKGPAVLPAQTVAVIDIGATAIRMEIAEIRVDGSVRTIEALHKAVNLGKDTFTTNRIQQSTIEECVTVLKGFRKTMQEYGVTDSRQIRAVATFFGLVVLTGLRAYSSGFWRSRSQAAARQWVRAACSMSFNGSGVFCSAKSTSWSKSSSRLRSRWTVRIETPIASDASSIV